MVCRVCLKQSEIELQIFDENGVEQRIPQILQLHLWFTPSPDDPISKAICLPCWLKLLEFHQFYEAAKEAHKFYQDQHEIVINAQNATTLTHPVEVVEAVFNVKHEDTNDEKWLDKGDDVDTQRNKSNSTEIINPLYEPEVLEPVTIKTESPEANQLDEYVAKVIRKRAKRVADNSQNVVKKLVSDDSADDDVDDGENSDEDIDFDVDTDSHSENESEKATETIKVKKTRNSKKSIKKTSKRGRPSQKPTLPKTAAKVANKITTITANKRKQEKRCWSTPKDDEMVAKHLTLNCELCCFHVETYTQMIKHFQDTHKNVRPYIVCCGRRICKRQRVVQHAYRHEDPNYFQCQICKKNFSDNYVLRSHILAHHPEEDELVHQCDQCEKRFSRRYLLELHKPTHIPVDERKFLCTKCPIPKAFASDHLLKIHDSMRHKRAANVCHVCAKSIRDNQAFEKHVRLHFEESGPRVKCPRPGCDRWLKDEDNLKQHLRRHNDEGKIITCDQCGKSVKNRRALSSHISYAHSTALFSCEECKKTFKKAITLKEHMAQHTGETLYKCPFCPRTFNSNANMHSHKKKMHPVQWDIWRKTKTGSSQTFQSNNQFMELVHSMTEEPTSQDNESNVYPDHDGVSSSFN